ncbi:hypothetical protein P154DRAFT_64361 [Amniculicola lignicola CBS 123094]|uniref:Uncharacterized protein n=1 Tax=Amniculicola lignicola CBS 123094 TaxID=1392246 RepID=A0A6A5WY53_9PLEO|nr:hypothetical protein P154DRAFT_64361 [Amniculicola lignicola CBS 123094]
MPSFLRTSRSYSFPPCIDNVEFAPTPEHDLPDIDDEPFAHFLTPVVEEDDPYDGLSMSAGIIVPDGPRTSKTAKFKSTVAEKWARYTKNHHVELHSRYHEAEADADDDESFMQLDDDRLLDIPHAVSQLTGPPTPRIIVTEPTRGRPHDLVARKSKPRRYSRTLSGHRHSWREPSPDLFTVEESDEEEGLMLKRPKARKNKDSNDRRRMQMKVDVMQRSKL